LNIRAIAVPPRPARHRSTTGAVVAVAPAVGELPRMSDGYVIPVIEVPLADPAADPIAELLPAPLPQLADAVRVVAVGSLNPAKVGAVRAVMVPLAPGVTVSGVLVPSEVRSQPWGDDETIRGARARALGALAKVPAAELGVGIEGGLVESDGGVRTCAWAVVAAREGRVGVGGSLALPLPPSVARRVRDGEELGEVMDALVGETNTKQGPGAVGILTAGLINRQRAYEALVTYALAPFLAGENWR
jgi:inosine/xanthosine triphosphatase